MRQFGATCGGFTPKYETYARLLESRIRQGDYAIGGLPTEQELADEIGVSRTTARRAMLELMQNGLLVRKPHGKVVVNLDHAEFAGQLRLAVLAPAFSSNGFEAWRFGVERVCASRNVVVRTVDYVHWDDAVIPQTLANFDGVFLLLSSEDVPPAVMERFSNAKNLIALGSDLTQWGVPSVRLIPPTAVDIVADHLYELGHRKISCLNTQPRDNVMAERIAHWSFWQRVRRVEGRLLDSPVRPFTHPAPHAYEVMKRELDAGRFDSTALVCLTDAAAMGAIRALYEHGLHVGRDVAIAVADSNPLGQLQVPARTMIAAPDARPFLEVCIDWFRDRRSEWIGPLLAQPASLTLFKGESTFAIHDGDGHIPHRAVPGHQPRAGEEAAFSG